MSDGPLAGIIPPMYVRDIGESQLIELLLETIDRRAPAEPAAVGHRLRVRAGDDAAAWEGPGGVGVLTSDAMVEGVHFDLESTGWRDLGWKCVAVNLSDVAAMGCLPGYVVAALGLREDLPVAGLVEMYEGVLDVCGLYGSALVGGDVVRSPVFFVSVAVTGAGQTAGPDGQPLLTRSAANVGDVVAVTGHVGCSGGGLRMMRERLSFDESTASHLMLAHNRPTPRLSEGALLAGHGVRAAIDVSDGLVVDLDKLCEASGVGAVVHADRVPADQFLRRAYPHDWSSLALTAGEDYELLLTAPPETMDAVARLMDTPITEIGEIVSPDAGVSVVDEDGKPLELGARGWDHFRKE